MITLPPSIVISYLISDIIIAIAFDLDTTIKLNALRIHDYF